SMGVWGCPHRDYPAWNRGRVHQAAAHLLASGKLHVEGLISHYIRFEKAADAYHLIEQQPSAALKVVLAY
ncbi:MAG: hypothetical protein K8I82_04450, partial [Anaerolineae bacterium]|nr:hypothetical protein [Anaerolineae bacterium]